eukprot:TRINITY_DN538_c0_g1_i1.p1 TRINITY_DN538_c0_g1~~TRINITY_DN538_c0_g1_i1.p1  ORF type:complete len:199 (+),score=39.11 TRINITY_DN538_c0_g1_i1:68-598(+)
MVVSLMNMNTQGTQLEGAATPASRKTHIAPGRRLSSSSSSSSTNHLSPSASLCRRANIDSTSTSDADAARSCAQQSPRVKSSSTSPVSYSTFTAAPSRLPSRAYTPTARVLAAHLVDRADHYELDMRKAVLQGRLLITLEETMEARCRMKDAHREEWRAQSVSKPTARMASWRVER